jgi:hypothetical protein
VSFHLGNRSSIAERKGDKPLQIKNIIRLAFVSILVGWCFDQLFWEKSPGLSAPIFILLCFGAGASLSWREDSLPRSTSLLWIPIQFFAFMTFFRLEPFTRLVGFGMLAVLMLIASLSWLGGGGWRYNALEDLNNGDIGFIRWEGFVHRRP